MDQKRFERLKLASLFGVGLTLGGLTSTFEDASLPFTILSTSVTFLGVMAMVLPIWVVLGGMHQERDQDA